MLLSKGTDIYIGITNILCLVIVCPSVSLPILQPAIVTVMQHLGHHQTCTLFLAQLVACVLMNPDNQLRCISQMACTQLCLAAASIPAGCRPLGFGQPQPIAPAVVSSLLPAGQMDAHQHLRMALASGWSPDFAQRRSMQLAFCSF